MTNLVRSKKTFIICINGIPAGGGGGVVICDMIAADDVDTHLVPRWLFYLK